MKATGIVRRIDDLGRVVIPKEIRRTQMIRVGDPLEIFVNSDGDVIFKKYSPVGELAPFAKKCAEVLYKSSSIAVCVCDRDKVVSTVGAKKDLDDTTLPGALERIAEQRKPSTLPVSSRITLGGEGLDMHVLGIAPIVCQGDLIGSVCFLGALGAAVPAEAEMRLLALSASILARQLEE